MNHQHASDRTHAAFRRPELVEGAGPPSSEFWILTSGFSPKNAKRTLNKTHAEGVPPLYLTPTEVGETPARQNMRNEPNPTVPTPKYTERTQFPHHTAEKCETNPIYPPPASPIIRNEPNSRTPGVQPPRPHPRKTRNEPNLPPQPPAQPPKNAKRTQSRPARYPKCAKRTQFPPTATSIMRNEPNLPPRCHLPALVIPAKAGIQNLPTTNQKCKTNPIPNHELPTEIGSAWSYTAHRRHKEDLVGKQLSGCL